MSALMRLSTCVLFLDYTDLRRAQIVYRILREKSVGVDDWTIPSRSNSERKQDVAHYFVCTIQRQTDTPLSTKITGSLYPAL